MIFSNPIKMSMEVQILSIKFWVWVSVLICHVIYIKLISYVENIFLSIKYLQSVVI